MAKKQENFLNYIPVISEKNSWDADAGGRVTIHMVHRGCDAWIAEKLFHRPRVSHIDLDELGIFIFRPIDGTRTVGQIAELVKAEFGQQAEPLYDRLVKYMQILRNNGFIRFAGKERP